MKKLIGIRLSNDEQQTLNSAVKIVQAMYDKTSDPSLYDVLKKMDVFKSVCMNGGIWTYEDEEL